MLNISLGSLLMRNRYYLFLLLTFLTTSPLSLQAMDERDTSYKTCIPSKLVPTHEDLALAKEVLEKGYFVHLAPLDLQKENFVLKSGATVPITLMRYQIHVPLTKVFRPCVYFSLNSVITEHANIAVSVRNYAVLIPTTYLLDKVVNLYPADTAIWGKEIDLKSIKGCTVFARTGCYDFTKNNWETIDLKPFEGSIHQVVNTFITEKTGHPIILVDAPEGYQPYCDQALCGKTDLNNPKLFDFFLKDKSYLSFGHETCPQKLGVGPWLAFYHTFYDDFLRLWKQTPYNLCPVEPKLMNKYRVAPYVTLAECGLPEMERMLVGAEEIADDFNTVQKPKILNAIQNFKNLIVAKTTNHEFNNRPINFILAARLADTSYECFKSAIESDSFNPEREEISVLYWLTRYTNKFHGVCYLDEQEELNNLTTAGKALQEKVSRKGYNWTYTRFLDSFISSLNGTPQTQKEFSYYIYPALEKISFLLPKTGTIQLKFKDRLVSLNFKEHLKTRELNIPENIWREGSDLPLFSNDCFAKDSY